MRKSSESEKHSFRKPLGTTLVTLTETKLVQAEISEFKGVEYLNVRIWVQLDDESWTPTRNGLTIPSNKKKRLSSRLAEFVRGDA